MLVMIWEKLGYNKGGGSWEESGTFMSNTNG
jgi:hypothetical protein